MQLKQELKPSLKQEQWVKLQMIQLMKILQLSNLELENVIRQEMEQNPVLEIKEKKEESIEELEEEELSEEPESDEEFLTKSGVEVSANDAHFQFPQEPQESMAKIIERTAARPPSLRDYLLEQFALRSKDFLESKIGEFLIGNIDQNGYLRIGTKEAAEVLGVDEKKVEEVLKVIQGLDPPGIGARDLKECLLLQAEVLELAPFQREIFQQIIEKHLDDLGRGRFNKIAKALNIKEENVREIELSIKKLNPYPGQIYSSEEVRNVVPEIVVRRNNGKFEVMVDSGRIPKLTLNRQYLDMLRQKENSAKEYIRNKVESAKLFIKSIEQRQLMIKKISEAIVQIQSDFFEKGVNYLKPLTMEEMARIQEVHPSTISRAIANKYIQSPRGIFPLKFFFSLPAKKGNQISSRSIKERIATLIEKEDKGNPLSDEQIANLLKKEGIELSRRTVAKYRQAIGIPSTFKRRG